jgi:hypothetical protein
MLEKLSANLISAMTISTPAASLGIKMGLAKRDQHQLVPLNVQQPFGGTGCHEEWWRFVSMNIITYRHS